MKLTLLLLVLVVLLVVADCLPRGGRGGGGGRSSGGRSGGWGRSSSSSRSSSRSSWWGRRSSSSSSSSSRRSSSRSSSSSSSSSSSKSSYPKQQWGKKVGNQKKPTYFSSPGYGTSYGTKFTSENKYVQKPGFSKKAVGLGVAAGFVGGAAVGVAGTAATYGVYHRYQNFKNMMSYRRSYHSHVPFQGSSYNGYDDDDDWGDYYSSYYSSNECMGGCPRFSNCEWGFCECIKGYERRYGQCQIYGFAATPRPSNFVYATACETVGNCQAIDINMVCKNRADQTGGSCSCKPDMKWNKEAGECQMFLNVNCTSITYDSKPSAAILEASKKAEAEKVVKVPSESKADKVPTIEESKTNSLLSKLDKDKATEEELTEAFCRDIDAYSFDFNTDTGKPPRCEDVPRTPGVCGVIHDSADCSGGWKLIITEGSISFPYFSGYWKYRNDADLIGVRAGCTLTAFSSTGFSGKREAFKTEANDVWWVLSEYSAYRHMDEDIESIQCICNKGKSSK